MSRKDLSTALCVRCLFNWGGHLNRNDTSLSVLQETGPMEGDVGNGWTGRQVDRQTDARHCAPLISFNPHPSLKWESSSPLYR